MENIEKLKERVARDPSSKLFLPLAEEYRKAGMHDEAIEVLKTGIEHQPDYMSARVALGKIYLEKDMKLEARDEFERVVKAIPDNLFAQRKLADIYRETGQGEKAVEQYRTVLALNPMDEEAELHLRRLSGASEGPAGEAGETEEEESAILEEFVPEEATYEEAEAAHEELAPAAAAGGEEVEQVDIEGTLEALSRAEERAGGEPAEEAPWPEQEEAEEELEIEEEPGEAVLRGFEGEEEMREDWAPDFAEADSYISGGDYRMALSAYKAMLARRPEDKHVLQRVEELKTLLKLLGKDKELLEANIEAFLEGIKRKRDEFFRGA